MKNLLALDVGFSATGFAVISDGEPIYCGVLTTERSAKKMTRAADDFSFRSSYLAKQLVDLINEGGIYGIVGELPSVGAQNAHAMAQMAAANAIVSAVAAVANVPTEWTSPREVKLAATGFASATKRMMCEAAIKRFGGRIEHKSVKCKRTKAFPEGVRIDQKYHILGKNWPEGLFEHIADALGAYLALENGTLARLQRFYREQPKTISEQKGTAHNAI